MPTINQYLAKGNDRLKQGKWKSALKYFEKIIKKDPQVAAAWQGKGEVYYQQHQFNLALTCFTQATHLNNQLIEGWYRIGCICLETGELIKAIDYFDKALHLSPKHQEALVKKGNILFLLEKFAEALACYEAVLEIDKTNYPIWVEKGKLHAHRGEFDKAIECFGEALTLKANLTSVWVEIAAALSNQQKFGQALGWYERVLEKEPENMPSLKGKGIAALHVGKFLEADQCLDQFLNQNKADGLALMSKGNIQLHLGRYDAALKLYDEAARVDPWFKGTHHKGLALRLMGRLDEADKLFQELQLASSDIETNKLLYQLGIIHFLRKDFKGADNYFNAISNTCLEYAWVLQAKGIYYLYLNRQGGFLALAWSYFTSQDYQQIANTYFLQAEGLIKKEESLTKKAQFFTEKGLLLMSIDFLDEARQAFEHALAYLPAYIPAKQGLDAYHDTKQSSKDHISIEKLNSLELCIPSKHINLGKKVATGGFGAVFHGQSFRSPAAIKQLLGTLGENEKEEFKREALMMAKLRHPNIVQIYGVVVDRDPYLLVMEWMAKGSLYVYLHQRPSILSWIMREKIAQDIACGLAYLHAQEIIHRDLKSHNVLLTDNYGAKIADFGLAKTKQEIMKNTNSEIAGTLAWIAPEIWQGKSFTDKSDMYSYAMTLWELASCRLPFRNVNPDLLKQWVVTHNRREDIPPDCSPLIKEIITKCWQPSPEDRLSASDTLRLFPN